MRRPSRIRLMLAGILGLVMAGTIAVGGVQPMDATAASTDPTTRLPKGYKPKSVDVTKVTPRKLARNDTATKRALTATPKVTWPAAGATTVDLRVQPKVVSELRVGTTPVYLDQASGLGRVKVEIADRARTAKAGVQGVLLRITPVDKPAANAKLRAALDYNGFAGASGGDWSRRLRLVQLSACAWDKPADVNCEPGKPSKRLASSNDRKAAKVLAPAVMSTTAPIVLATTAGTSSDAGDYSATSLSASASWSAGGNSGDFGWSYPLRTPPAIGGPAPSLNLSYSSQSVDGRVASTNNQPSWVGEGWELANNYVERKFGSCSDDGQTGKGDLCWKHDNATLVLNGKSTELVRNDADGKWRLKDDDGSKVEKLTQTLYSNGDNDKEYWRVTTTDGVQYYFGTHVLPGWSTGKAGTNSVFWAPVAGDDAGEPCYNSAGFSSSFCNQAWRWNLDYVVDPNGNAMSYWYSRDTNYYRKNGDTPSLYVPGGYLARIDYGQRSDTMYTATAPMSVAFTTKGRCIPVTGGETCASLTSTNKAAWPDVPFDQICADGGACTDNIAPTFFLRKRLTTIATSIQRNGAADPVDTWTLDQSFPKTGDASSASLWLKSVQQTAQAGSGADVKLSPVVFAGEPKANRVDSVTDGYVPLFKYRMSSVTNETGGKLDVFYKDIECVRGAFPDPKTNTKTCFPSYWTPEFEAAPKLDWFHKYVVDQVNQIDTTGQSPDVRTSYGYSGGGAWHYDNGDGITPKKYQTYSQWRGFAKTTSTTGNAAEGKQSQTSELYYQGMGGTITDSQGGTPTDSDHLAGFVRETRTFDGAGGSEVSGAITTPWAKSTATRNQSWGDATAHIVREGTVKTRITLDGGRADRTTSTVTTYTDDGLEETLDDRGDDATGADDRCVRTEYQQNKTGDNWLLAFPSRAETVSASCGGTTSRPSDVLSDVKTTYDGNGNPTVAERLASYSGSTPVYQKVSTQRYDIHGRSTSITDADNKSTTTDFTPTTGGPVTKTVATNPLGHTTTTDLDPALGVETGKIDANGNRTDLSYDGMGRLTDAWLPGLPKANSPSYAGLRFTYQTVASKAVAVGTQTLREDGKSYVTSYKIFDSWLRPRQSQTPAVGVVGRIVATTKYDSRGQVTREGNDLLNTQSAPIADLVETAQPDANYPSITDHVYDGASRETKSTYYAVGTEKWSTITTYGGDRVGVDPPDGAPGTMEITDARGNVTERRQYPAGAPTGDFTATKYGYDPAGRLASITDDDGNAWTYKFDLRGRQTENTDPDKGKTVLSYDDMDRLATTSDARSKTLAYSYDTVGRKTGLYSGSTAGTKLAEWKYDTASAGKGKLASSTRYVGSTSYVQKTTSYDRMGRVTEAATVIPASEGAGISGTYTSTWNYSAWTGRLYDQSQPAAGGLSDELLSYEYNDAGLPTAMDAGDSMALDATYNSIGDPDLWKMAPGTADQKTFNWAYEQGTRRLTGMQVSTILSGIIADHYWYYKNSGLVSAQRERASDAATDELECYRHDGYARLAAAWTQEAGGCTAGPSQSVLGGPEKYWTSWTYTNTGMRSTQTRHAPAAGGADQTMTNAFPAAKSPRPHAATSVTGGSKPLSYDYDTTGNTTSRTNPVTGEQQTLDWDDEGRLAGIAEGTAGASSYVYDADGNLLLRKDKAETVLYLDGTEVHKPAGGTAAATRFFSFSGKTIASRTGNKVDYLITDHHNTPFATYDTATKTATFRRTDPFSAARGATDALITNPSGWNAPFTGFVGGKRDDNNALIRLGARDYDATLGMFTSVDPILDSSDPSSLTGYGYAANNPTSTSDPSGLMNPKPMEERGRRSTGKVTQSASELANLGTYTGPSRDDYWRGRALDRGGREHQVASYLAGQYLVRLPPRKAVYVDLPAWYGASSNRLSATGARSGPGVQWPDIAVQSGGFNYLYEIKPVSYMPGQSKSLDRDATRQRDEYLDSLQQGNATPTMWRKGEWQLGNDYIETKGYVADLEVVITVFTRMKDGKNDRPGMIYYVTREWKPTPLNRAIAESTGHAILHQSEIQQANKARTLERVQRNIMKGQLESRPGAGLPAGVPPAGELVVR